MKISAALALFSMAYVSSTAKVIQQSTQLENSLTAVPGAGQQAAGFPPLSPLSASSSQAVTAGVASQSDPDRTTVTHRTATQYSAGLGMNPGFPGGAYFPGAYPGSFTGPFPSFYNGASHGYTRATYPGLSTGTFSRSFRRMFPGLSGRAYRSLYGSRLLGYGAAGWFPMDYARVRVGFTMNPLTGQPTFPLNPFATGGSFPSLYPVPGQGPQPPQLPVPFLEGTTPGASATTSVGTATVSHGQQGSAVMSSQQQNLVRTQSRVQLSRRGAE